LKENLFGRLIRIGATLTQSELIALLNVPGGPLRKALQVFESEGLLIMLPRSGIRIVKPDMTLMAMAYVSVIDAPERIANSSKIGAYVGLTPRRYQSGEEDYAWRILRCGDKLLRTYLFERRVSSSIASPNGQP
jgi:hypothetical protein